MFGICDWFLYNIRTVFLTARIALSLDTESFNDNAMPLVPVGSLLAYHQNAVDILCHIGVIDIHLLFVYSDIFVQLSANIQISD